MKLGFIGGWGHHYLRELLRAGQAPMTIDAAASGDGHDLDAARRFASTQNITTWYDDPAKLMQEFKPDALSIGAVYFHNGELAAAALERGIPTVSDKPIAATWDQLALLRRLAQDSKRILLTEFDFRCKPEFRAAQLAVAGGVIGEVVLATAQKSYRFGTRPPWYADRNHYPGTLMWIASHGIDAIDWVAGRRLTKVIGHQGNVSKPDYGSMEDHLAVLIELDNGGTGVVHADFLRPQAASSHGDDRLRIAGSKGVLEVRDGRCKLITFDKPEADITDSGTCRPMHLELLAALRGEKNPWYSTEKSLATAEILLHARDATDGQKWVRLA
jgi:predicted dehydrogenase